jgi:hypothetical protein
MMAYAESAESKGHRAGDLSWVSGVRRVLALRREQAPFTPPRFDVDLVHAFLDWLKSQAPAARIEDGTDLCRVLQQGGQSRPSCASVSPGMARDSVRPQFRPQRRPSHERRDVQGETGRRQGRQAHRPRGSGRRAQGPRLGRVPSSGARPSGCGSSCLAMPRLPIVSARRCRRRVRTRPPGSCSPSSPRARHWPRCSRSARARGACGRRTWPRWRVFRRASTPSPRPAWSTSPSRARLSPGGRSRRRRRTSRTTSRHLPLTSHRRAPQELEPAPHELGCRRGGRSRRRRRTSRTTSRHLPLTSPRRAPHELGCRRVVGAGADDVASSPADVASTSPSRARLSPGRWSRRRRRTSRTTSRHLPLASPRRPATGSSQPLTSSAVAGWSEPATPPDVADDVASSPADVALTASDGRHPKQSAIATMMRSVAGATVGAKTFSLERPGSWNPRQTRRALAT